MATKKIDTLQSAQLAVLATDVAELRTKLNLAVTDAIAISAKLNILIDDLNDMNEVVMDGYTTPNSPESYGILEAMDVYKDKMVDHLEIFTGDWGPNANNNNVFTACDLANIGVYSTGTTTPPSPYDIPLNFGSTPLSHPPSTLTYCIGSGGGGQTDRTAPGGGGSGWQGGSGSGHDGYDNPVVDGTGQSGNTGHSADAEDSAVVGSYLGDKIGMLDIKTSNVKRAKKLARQTLNRLRK